MVNKIIIEEVIIKSINTIIGKCPIGYLTPFQRMEQFNQKDFKEDKFPIDKRTNPSPVGRLQKIQEDLQENVEYKWFEKEALRRYSIYDFWAINAWYNREESGSVKRDMEGLYSRNPDLIKEYWKHGIYVMDGLTDDSVHYTPRHCKYSVNNPNGDKEYYSIPDFAGWIDDMIDKTPPLQENTILFRVGHFDKGLKAGDVGRWKSVTSTSFNSYVAKKGLSANSGFVPDEERYQLKIYAPKGTKGIVPCVNTGCEDWQSEFLIDKGQKYVILNVDDDKKTAEILLY